jgi:hypothetical protein
VTPNPKKGPAVQHKHRMPDFLNAIVSLNEPVRGAGGMGRCLSSGVCKPQNLH